MAKDHGASIKDDDTYVALRRDGAPKEKAARIANAQANRSMAPPKKGGQQPSYEEWTMDELLERAKEIGITGRWDLNKDELIDALRSH